MKKIDKYEIFQNLKTFLKGKGIELQEGSYTRRIQQGCGLLADTVNLSQQAVHCAREQVGKRLDQVRRVIHEKTGPRPAANPPPQSPPAPEPAAAKASTRTSRKTAKRRRTSSPRT